MGVGCHRHARAFSELGADAEPKTRAAAKIAQCNEPRDPTQLDCWLEAQALETPDTWFPTPGCWQKS